MTVREAIIELDSIAHDFEDERIDTDEWVGYEYDSDEAAEAVRMAIKAFQKINELRNFLEDDIEKFTPDDLETDDYGMGYYGLWRSINKILEEVEE